MTAVMSYQYPPLPPGPDQDDTHSHMMNSYHLPALGAPTYQQQQHHPDRLQSPPDAYQAAAEDPKKAHMRRAMSSPNVRKQASTDALNAEKRRNKLGYHRTSVACGHCRRRKIRCIPAPGDVQHRCSNCIRLKKECNFFPVDQQPPTDPNRRESKSQAFRRDSASPSSAEGQPLHMPPGSYHPLAMPPLPDILHARGPRPDSFSPDAKTGEYPRQGEFAHPNAGWISSDTAGGPSKPPSDMNSSYGWRMANESPITPAFSPYPNSAHLPSQANWPPASAIESGPRENVDWNMQATQRSMSFSNLEGLPHNAPYQPFQSSSSSHVREAGAPRSTVIQQEGFGSHIPSSSSASSAEAIPGQPSNSLNQPQGPGQPSAFPAQPGWSSYTYDKAPLPASGAGYPVGQWYAPAPHVPSQPAGQPPVQHPNYPPAPQQYSEMYYPPQPHQGR